MTITELNEQFPVHPPTDRADGVHLGRIITDLNNTIFPKQVYPDWDSQTPEQQAETILQWETGFLWEDAFSRAFAERVAPRPCELCVDGIYCNPDGVDVEHGIVHEYKATWGSMSKGIDSRWRWMTQVKGYCHAFGFTKAIFHVLWICGDYSRPIKPQYKSYAVDFGKNEVSETWAMVLSHARRKGWV
jgi:hypothetical protein